MRLPKFVLIGLLLVTLIIGIYLSALVTQTALFISPAMQHHSIVQGGKGPPNSESYLFTSPVLHFHVIAQGGKGPPNSES
jgi:hypothetical protein